MVASPVRPYVLLVEDCDDDAFFFRRALKQSGIGCSLFHVTDGAAAIKYLTAAQAAENPSNPWPDLIFLDLKLPSYSGFEVLNWIREQKLESRLDVGILSGSEHPPDIRKAKQLGAEIYSVKPVSVQQLRTRLQEWMAKHANSQGETAPAARPVLSQA